MRDPDTQPIPRVGGHRRGGGERRRALIALAVLAVIAVGIVAIMVAVLGGGSSGAPSAQSTFRYNGPPVTKINQGSNNPQPTGGRQPSQSHTSHRDSSHPNSSHPNSSHPKPSHRPTKNPYRGPSNRPVSCHSAGPCPLRDDIGDALGALNAYRQQHGLRPVAGSVTQAAAICAASAAGHCPNGFHWEPVGRSGREVIKKIAQRGGDGFLLSPRLKRVQIGWAYVPSSHSFYCALVAPGT